jgi:hypothetical protein
LCSKQRFVGRIEQQIRDTIARIQPDLATVDRFCLTPYHRRAHRLGIERHELKGWLVRAPMGDPLVSVVCVVEAIGESENNEALNGQQVRALLTRGMQLHKI